MAAVCENIADIIIKIYVFDIPRDIARSASDIDVPAERLSHARNFYLLEDPTYYSARVSTDERKNRSRTSKAGNAQSSYKYRRVFHLAKEKLSYEGYRAGYTGDFGTSRRVSGSHEKPLARVWVHARTPLSNYGSITIASTLLNAEQDAPSDAAWPRMKMRGRQEAAATLLSSRHDDGPHSIARPCFILAAPAAPLPPGQLRAPFVDSPPNALVPSASDHIALSLLFRSFLLPSLILRSHSLTSCASFCVTLSLINIDCNTPHEDSQLKAFVV